MRYRDIITIENHACELLVRLSEFHQETATRQYMDTGEAQAIIDDCRSFIRQVKKACQKETR